LGYQRLIHERSDILRKRAETYRKDILNSLPVFLTARLLGPSRRAKEYARELCHEIKSELEAGSAGLALKSWGALGMAYWTALCLKFGWFQHPRLTKLAYRLP
jgi:hypothetical protein